MSALINALRGGWLTRDRARLQENDIGGAAPRVDGLIWLIIAVTAGVAVLSGLLAGFGIAWQSFAAPAGTSVILIAIARFYRSRNDNRPAAALEGTAQIMAFAAVGAPLSYLAASLNLPLRDAVFDAFDHALGFDWIALLDFMNAHPVLQPVATDVYLTFAPQLTATLLVLGFSGRLDRLRGFVLAFMIAALATIAISALVPAEGAWSHYGLVAAPNMMMPNSHTSWPVFHGLRDGSYRLLLATGAEGIITFPSLHAALAIIFVLALWEVTALRPIALLLNVAMLAATPIDGSHYLVDLLAGVAVAAGSWLAARKITRHLRV